MTVTRPRRTETPAGPSLQASIPGPWSANRRRMAVGVAALVGGAHAIVVAAHYRVGSFDDDANYILVARALATGAGLTTKVGGTVPLVSIYPPGYPALLAPLALIWPRGLLPFRVLSLVCFLALFPLTWVYLRRRNLPPAPAVAVLIMLALNPVAATYATMVMAEAPFLVALLVVLLVLPRWEVQPRTLTAAGGATVVLVASIVWLKEAGVGLAVGVVAWLVLRRLWRKAALVAAGTVGLLLPVIVARAIAGVALIGSRYSTELGGSYPGSLVHRIVHLPPMAASAYIRLAIPLSIVPTDVSPLPRDGPISVVLAILQWTATPLVIIGFVVWLRRHRDVTTVAIPVYLIETLLFPFTNERRVILVLPLILAWYVLGAWAVVGLVVHTSRAHAPRALAPATRAVPLAAAALVLGALLPQVTRDYLYATGQNSSAPAGSPYMAFLHAVGHRSDVVETSYLWSTALFSGHRTANAAFNTPTCDQSAITSALRRDGAGFLLSAALNQPGMPDGWCLLPSIADQPGLVLLYSSPQDLASVFELTGPGSAHPDLSDLVPGSTLTSAGSNLTESPAAAPLPGYEVGAAATTPTVAGQASLTWSWGQPRPISQISLGFAAGAPAATTTAVVVAVLGAAGQWRQVSIASGPVGAGEAARYLLVSFASPTTAKAVRVTVAGQGTVTVGDLHVLGPQP